jgi:hypothetical protein
MRQGTTPIVSLTIDVERDEDDVIVPSSVLDGCNVFVTIDQNGTQITKASRESSDIQITKNYDKDDPTRHISTTVAMYLTQAETLGLEVGNARAQLRWVNFIDEAFASDIATIKIEESLLEEVIDYGN